MIEGEETWTKRSKLSAQFIDHKKAPAEKPYKGVQKGGNDRILLTSRRRSRIFLVQ